MLADPTAFEGALAQLRLKLLDLSGRNRLLNFKHTAGRSLQFVEGHPSSLFRGLVDAPNRSIVTITGLPEPPLAEWMEHNGRRMRPDAREWARRQGIPTSFDLSDAAGEPSASVRALLYPDDLAKHCRKIEREAVSAIEETGANMLFLVLGFLEFPDQRGSDRTFFAPLISVPVAMSKRDIGGQQTFSFQYTGDDIAENLSLREKLRRDHSLILPELDEEQIDIDSYLLDLQRVIKGQPGFSVRRWSSLCMLSFANMLIVRDIDPDKWPRAADRNGLIDHPIVREVLEGRADEADMTPGDAAECDVENGPAARLPLVFDADSLQHSALVDVLVHGRNLVIEGPPGTGKWQTIANLIAASLATGKSVLFVAEKLAALEVVKDRLARARLDPFVLELHSNKSNKKRGLEELAGRVKHHPRQPIDLLRKTEQLTSYHSALKSYSDLINSVSHNALGLTIHQVMWRAEVQRSSLTVDERLLAQLSVANAAEISALELLRRTDCLDYLGSQYRDIGGFERGCIFWGFFPDRIIPGDEASLRVLFTNAREWADQFLSDVSHYTSLVDDAFAKLSAASGESQLRTLQSVLDSSRRYQSLHLVPRLFAEDHTGERARRLLDTLAQQIEHFTQLSHVVRRGLRHDAAPDQSRLEKLRQLDRIAGQLGATLGTPREIDNLCLFLRRECERLSGARWRDAPRLLTSPCYTHVLTGGVEQFACGARGTSVPRYAARAYSNKAGGADTPVGKRVTGRRP